MTGVIVNTRDFYYICIDIPDTFIGFLSSVSSHGFVQVGLDLYPGTRRVYVIQTEPMYNYSNAFVSFQMVIYSAPAVLPEYSVHMLQPRRRR